MSTDHQRTIQPLIKQRKLLIADITRMAIEPMTDHQFREQLEALVSYNVCNDGVCQDCIYIEQGHYMNPNTFQSNSMAIDPRRSVVVTWTPVTIHNFQWQPSQPWCPQV